MKIKNLDGRELFGVTLKENNFIEGSWKRYFEEAYNDEESSIGFVTKKEYSELWDKNDMQIKYRFLVEFYQDYEKDAPKDIYVNLYLVPNFEFIHKDIIAKIQKDYDSSFEITTENLRIEDLMWNCQLPVLTKDEIYCTRSLKSFHSTKITEALEIAAKVCDSVAGLIGFYMDNPENMIGTTGWDYLNEIVNGEDAIKATMERWRKQKNNQNLKEATV